MPTHSACHDGRRRYCLSCIGSAALRRLFDLAPEITRIEVGAETRDLAVSHLQDAHTFVRYWSTSGTRPSRCPLQCRPAITYDDIAEGRGHLSKGVPVRLPKRACSLHPRELSWGDDVADLTLWPEQSGDPIRVALALQDSEGVDELLCYIRCTISGSSPTRCFT